MAKIYQRRIAAGIMAVEDVPLRWRAEVQVLIGGDNFVPNTGI